MMLLFSSTSSKMAWSFRRCLFLLVSLVVVTLATETTPLGWESRLSYSSLPSSPAGRHHPIVFANETHAFVLGGSTFTNTAAPDFFMYTEAEDRWTDLTSTSSAFPGLARSFGYGVVLPQANHPKAYLGFGAAQDNQRLSDLWEFDMHTHEWKQLADCPGLGRRHPSMVPVYVKEEAKWYIHVGLGDGYLDDAMQQFSNFNDYWSYDIALDTWTQLPDFPSSRRHHPFFFGIGDISYVGLGHSDGRDPYIERDFYSFDAITNAWTREPDFESYLIYQDNTTNAEQRTLATTEARVAGTEFSIELPIMASMDDSNEMMSNTSATSSSSSLCGSLGFVLSGDGDDHSSMATGEFHAFYPQNSPLSVEMIQDTTTTASRTNDLSPAWWRQLTPHPGGSRWAPASFVMRGTARTYFTSGYDRATGILHSDLWFIDLSSLFQTLPTTSPTPTTTTVSSSNATSNTTSVNTGEGGREVKEEPEEEEEEEEDGVTIEILTSVGSAAPTTFGHYFLCVCALAGTAMSTLIS